MATRRVQIREAGILTKRRLIRWRELLGFSLELDGVLRFRRQAPEGKMIGCTIPAADRETVAHLLSSRLPALSICRSTSLMLSSIQTQKHSAPMR
jgi:hypothetical protein